MKKLFFLMTHYAKISALPGATIRKKASKDCRKEEDMTETIYERRPGGNNQRRSLPNNRRQIGQPGQGTLEVFIEDYAFSYAKGLSERDYTGCVVGVLVGEHMEGAQGDKLLIRGVLEARDVLRQEAVCFTEDNWTGIYRDIREFFPDMQIVGWFLGGPGFLLEDTERQKKIQEDNFGGGDKVLLKIDSAEKEQKFLYYQEGTLQELPGFYIYYERNAEMQNYMAEARQKQPVGEKPKESTEKRFHTVLSKEQESSDKEQLQQETGMINYPITRPAGFYRLFYATSGILTCVAILVIAGLAMQIQERNKLEELLNEQERLVASLQQVYVVEEGETVESICMKFYGSTEQEAAIRLLNSLEFGEEPEEGQKLFLP